MNERHIMYPCCVSSLFLSPTFDCHHWLVDSAIYIYDDEMMRMMMM
jgi:hypothetical protein